MGVSALFFMSFFGFPGPLTEPDIEIVKLTEGVWRHISKQEIPNYGLYPSNGLISVKDGKAVIVDTAWSHQQTEQLLDRCAEKGWQVVAVIITHFHLDRLAGLEVFHRRGIPSYARPQTTRLAKAAGNPLPQRPMQDDQILQLGGQSLRVFYPGPGHTLDNTTVWFPQSKVLFGGCLVRPGDSRSLGNTEDADLTLWPKSMQKLLDEFPEAEFVVPGHHAPGHPDLLSHTLFLLQSQ